MNIRTISNLIGAALIGGVIGFYVHAHMLQSIQVTLFSGDYTKRLTEDSAALMQLKSNNVSCLKSSVSSRVENGLEQAAFYRNLAADNEKALKRVNDALQFAQQALSATDQVVMTVGVPCP